MGSEYSLGIDLGTTFSAAAISTADSVEVFPLGARTATIPSVVVVREHGEVLVGEAAERRALSEPARSAREFKRRLGDPTPILLGGVPYGAESLTAHLLRAVVEQVVERQGCMPSRIALTHPATYRDYKLDLMRLAVGQADVGEVTFVSEPEAAALYYAGQDRLATDDVVAVYDFGGGTFDATVVRKTSDGFELAGTPEGMERIGGIDFDEALLAHVDEALGGSLAELDVEDPATRTALARLRDECRQAKEALSSDTDVTIPVALPGLNTEVRVTRAGFEGLIRPRVAETIEALERAVRSAGLTTEGLARVLLVGGTSHIPLVRQLVRDATGRPVALDTHPKHSVSLGAASLVRPSAEPAVSTPAQLSTPPPVETAPAAVDVVPPAIAPPADEPRSSRKALVAAACVLLLVGCAGAFLLLRGGSNGASAATSATTAAPVASSTDGSPASTPAAINAAAGSGRFGDLEFTLGSPTVNGQSLTVPLKVHNPLSAKPLSVSGLRFRATTPGGAPVEPSGAVDSTPIGPGASTSLSLTFPVAPATSPSGAVLTVDAPGKEPLALPLTGARPAADARSIAASGTASYATATASLSYALRSATLSFDRQIEEGTFTEAAAERRAKQGDAYLSLGLTLTASTCQCPGGVNWSNQQLHLLVDGATVAPWTSDSGVVQAGASVDLMAGFEIPAGAKQVVLQVGDASTGDTTSQITIDLAP